MKKLLIISIFIVITGQINARPSEEEIKRRMEKVTEKTQSSSIVPLLLEGTASLISHCTEEYTQEIVEQFHDQRDPKIIIFLLANAHSYAPNGYEQKKDLLQAQLVAAIAHQKTIEAFFNQMDNPDYTGLSPTEKTVIHNCATIKQKIQNDQDAGTVEGKDPSFFNFFGSTTQYSGTEYYKNACQCSFYDLLSDKQLEELTKATA